MNPALVIRSALAGLAAAACLWNPSPAWAQREPAAPGGTGLRADWSGWLQADTAYAWRDPSRFTNGRVLGELAGKGQVEGGAKWKLSARAAYDAAYDLQDHYPSAVRRDQRAQAWLHEAYLDFSAGSWEFRVGKQNIVWGEMVGLFFADVVSAKDLRGFLLPEFDLIRIPQWAARAEWYGDDVHLEFVWLPAPEVDRIGFPGAEFYPAPWRYQGLGYDIEGARRPGRRLSNSGVGVRLSALVDGWDFSAFAYRAPDTQEAFQRSLLAGPPPTVVYRPTYGMATRVGGTVAKDFDGIVAKAEVVYTDGRRFGLIGLDPGDGLVALRTLDWVAGVDLTPADGWRVNAQVFQRAFLDHDARIGLRRQENGASLLVNRTLVEGVEAEALGITSLDRRDWLLRTMLVWKRGANARVRVGADFFGGVPEGQFGRYGDRDRVWAEYRYSF